MISGADTLIAGILIFLIIVPFSSDVVLNFIERRSLSWTVYVTLSLFALSTSTIFFAGEIPERVLTVAKLFTIAGIFGIMFAIITALRRLPRFQRTQRGGQLLSE